MCIICVFSNANAQDLSFYQKVEDLVFFNKELNDSIGITIHLTQDYDLAPNQSFPLILVMDSQNEINHRYNLHTMDYLTGLGGVPGAVIVSLKLKDEKRGLWTIPAAEGGLGDALLNFIIQDLHNYISKKYRLNKSRFIIGHSRTAIFAMYALSASADFFTGIVASSAAYFDGGSQVQKKVFDEFIKTNRKTQARKYFYFSSGTDYFGDGHEAYCEKLNEYLKEALKETNIEWAFIKEDADHFTIPGLTVNRALNNIFREYRVAQQDCFEVLKNEKYATSVPWNMFSDIYKKSSQKAGYEITPDLTFYFSIASAYANDYDGFFKDNSSKFALELLLEGEKVYPNVCEILGWIQEILAEKGDARATFYESKLPTCVSLDE
jgi:enterochelin esterase-like enzyme